MDKRKRKRAVLTVGLLFFIIVVLCGESWLLGKKMQEIEQKRMGMLAELHPEWELEIVAAFQDSDEDTAGGEAAQKTGNSLAEKYGMAGLFSNGYQPLQTYVIAIFATVIAGFAGILMLRTRDLKKEALILEQEERKLEELKELTVRYDQIKNRLEKEENDTKTLITDISHQLKTPIASLKMSYELLESTPLSEIEYQEFRKKEYEELKKLEGLLESLMNLSKLETRMIQIRPVPVSIKETLRNAVNSVYIKAMDKQIEISMEEFQDRKIPHDFKWTTEVFVNILDNGIKYSPEKTRITIQVSELVFGLLIEIRDEGIGIAPKEMHQVFKRFYRGSSEAVLSVEGSGVGLYLARRILEEQGGTIRVKAAAGQGSIFQVTMPYEIHSL